MPGFFRLKAMLDFSQNYFELFDLPLSFEVDRGHLAEKYRDLQKVAHPDRYANASGQERRLSLQQSTLINTAFETLKDPLKRASYILSLRGIDIDTQKGGTMDPGFLMEQMELREAIAEAKSKPDPIAELDELMDKIKGMLREIESHIGEQLDDEVADNHDAATEAVRKMQFLYKLNSEAEALEAELEEAI